MKRNFLSASVLLVALYVFAALSGQASSADAQATREETKKQEVVLLDPKSNPMTLLVREYRDSGYTTDQALAIVHKQMGLEYIDVPMPDKPVEGAVLLDPKSNPVTLLQRLFQESGWSPQEAADIACKAMGFESAKMNESLCQVYEVQIVYCAGTPPQKYTLATYLSAICWQDPDANPATDDGLKECITCQCAGGQTPWLSLTVSSLTACEGLPAGGTCISLHVLGSEPVNVRCDVNKIECNCFTEFTNCAQIECCCCNSHKTGCSECPSCSGECPDP